MPSSTRRRILATKRKTRPRLSKSTVSPGPGKFSVGPPRKRRKTSQNANHQSESASGYLISTSSKRRKGKLVLMTNMPVDILYETFSHLEPLDLLHLSRATKDLRALLLTKAALAVWQSAFTNANPSPPPCPLELNYPQYANLLYGHYCQFCASAYGTNAMWPFYVRCCHSCVDSNFMPENSSNQLEKMLQGLCSRWFIPCGSHDRFLWFKPDVDATRKEYYKKWSAGKEAVNAWRNQRADQKIRRSRFALSMKHWLGQVRHKRNLEIKETRAERWNQIISKLENEGWKEELRHIPRAFLESLPAFKQLRELTDRSWTYIKPGLNEVLEEQRNIRLRTERHEILSLRVSLMERLVEKYTKTLEPNAIVPGIIDLILVDPFKRLIFNTPLTETLVMGNLIPLISEFSPRIAAWKDNRAVFLESLVPTHKRSQLHSHSNTLQLATTFFQCAWCREAVSYPRILIHRCLYNIHSDTNTIDGEEGDLRYIKRETSWNPENTSVSFYEEASHAANMIVSAIGQQPRAITMKEMDDIDARVECTRCVTTRSRLVMRWSTAIMHILEHHRNDVEPIRQSDWRILSEEESRKAHDTEKINMSRWRMDVGCKLCRTTMTRKEVREHLLRRHDKPPRIASEPEYIYIPLDIPTRQPPYAVRIPI